MQKLFILLSLAGFCAGSFAEGLTVSSYGGIVRDSYDECIHDSYYNASTDKSNCNNENSVAKNSTGSQNTTMVEVANTQQ